MRNYNREYQDNDRQYAYEFDGILRHYMMRTFEPFLPQGHALEMGCYQGDMTTLLVSRFQSLTVIEASDELIQKTKSRVNKPITYLCDTFERIEINKHFDAVFLIHTLEHLDDPKFVLEKIKSWLTPAGLLFVAVPNANAPSRQIAVKIGLINHNCAVTEAERKHGHRVTYSFDTLESVIKRAGLAIKHRGGIFFKGLANFQLDNALHAGVITQDYLEGCYQLGMQYPDLCASIYMICGREGNP